MTETFTDYNPTTYLTSPAAVAEFMSDALETADSAYVAKALGVVARAKGMTELAKQTGLSREQLCRSFSEHGNPTLKTLLTVMKALGVDLAVRAHLPH